MELFPILLIFTILSLSNQSLSTTSSSLITFYSKTNKFSYEIDIINTFDLFKFSVKHLNIVTATHTNIKDTITNYRNKAQQFILLFTNEATFISFVNTTSFFTYKNIIPTIIIDNNINISQYNIYATVNTKSFPIFSFNSSLINNKVVSASIIYHRKIIADEIAYYGIISILLISLITNLIWSSVIFKMQKNNLMDIHRVFFYLINICCILSGLILYYIILTIKEKENDIESLSKGYIYLGILILHFTVKCFLAFVAIFDANGLQVTSQSILENSKISTFIVAVVFFIELGQDTQIQDNFIFTLNDILSSIFYIVISINVLQKGLHLNKYLNKEITYARIRSPHTITALSLKKILLKRHITSILIYTFLYISFLLVHKLKYYTYSNYLTSLVCNNCFNYIQIVLFMVVYHPRKLPPYYIIRMNEDLSFSYVYTEDSEASLTYYRYKEKEIDYIIKEKEEFKGIKEEDESNLVLVINPFYNKNEKNILMDVTKIKIGLLNNNE